MRSSLAVISPTEGPGLLTERPGDARIQFAPPPYCETPSPKPQGGGDNRPFPGCAFRTHSYPALHLFGPGGVGHTLKFPSAWLLMDIWTEKIGHHAAGGENNFHKCQCKKMQLTFILKDFKNNFYSHINNAQMFSVSVSIGEHQVGGKTIATKS